MDSSEGIGAGEHTGKEVHLISDYSSQLVVALIDQEFDSLLQRSDDGASLKGLREHKWIIYYLSGVL